MSRPKHKPTYALHQGFRIPMGFPADCFESGLGYQAQAGDNFIVTYPKCGTTWTQHIVWMLQQNGQPLPVGKDINREIPHLEQVGSEFVAALPAPRFIKTHLPHALTPYHPEAKYIYIARNPFDCVVSFYYHTQGFVKHYDFAEGTFADFFECFINGEVDFGDYFEHLVPWYACKDNANVLFLTYEDMVENTQRAVIEMAKFLGTQYSKQLKKLDVLNNILHHTSFAQMSQKQSRWSSKRPNYAAPFIRKGKVGDWQNHFSQEQAMRLVDKFRVYSAQTNIEKLWPGLLDDVEKKYGEFCWQ
ncbi:MAG: sulfotransferase domain-containing protein [Xenococcus sp. MO_188.B8]|nr:sulfotransferase domain-containing protein [Xenococcus sp. MO_188.B8]